MALAKFRQQLAAHGSGSLQRSLANLERRLAEHLAKLRLYEQSGGYTSSIRREIRNFTEQIEAIRKILEGES